MNFLSIFKHDGLMETESTVLSLGFITGLTIFNIVTLTVEETHFLHTLTSSTVTTLVLGV